MGKRKRRLERKAARREKCREIVSGVFSAAAGGFGFVTQTDGQEVFIPPHFVGSALDGDTVKAEILSRSDERGPVGKIAGITARTRKLLVGTLKDPHTLLPLDKVLPHEIAVSGGVRGARRGDYVLARLLSGGSGHTEKLKCAVEEAIGRSGTVEGDLRAVAREFDLPPPYSPEEEARVLTLEPVSVPRKDLTGLFVLTIDPADAHDFDDALSISETEKEWIIGVHIADVACWIRPGTKFDRSASSRAFSSYIPGMFRPMLPKTLTSKISLREGEISSAHTFLLHVRKYDGKVVSHERMHSRIRVRKRLSYEEVQVVIDGKTPPGNWSAECGAAVDLLRKAVAKMRRRRKKTELFLEIPAPEIRVLVEEESFRISGMEKRVQRESESLVEECMLAANTAAAEELSLLGMAGLYRNHPEPEEVKLEEFSALAELLLKRKTGDLSSRTNCDAFLKSIPPAETDPRRELVFQAFLRTMQRARYEAEPALHYGLGKGRYSHFTSPIRRYADLLIHQQFLAHDLNTRLRSRAFLARQGELLTKKEKANDEAYFAALDRLKLHLIRKVVEEDPEKMFEALVVKRSGQGILCDIPEFGLRGFVPGRFAAPGRKKKEVRAGDFIYLYLESLDFQRGSASFRPVT